MSRNKNWQNSGHKHPRSRQIERFANRHTPQIRERADGNFGRSVQKCYEANTQNLHPKRPQKPKTNAAAHDRKAKQTPQYFSIFDVPNVPNRIFSGFSQIPMQGITAQSGKKNEEQKNGWKVR